jgi:parallel beta-helix repeat protein
MKKITLSTVLFLCAYSLWATNYYCDPATGNRNNPGTAASPWKNLYEVFRYPTVTFVAGDTIFLRNGYHGTPIVGGNNNGYVYIKPEAGHQPTINRLQVNNAKYWDISGLKISPEFTSPQVFDKKTLVEISTSTSYIKVSNCTMYSVSDLTNLDSATVKDKFSSGISVAGPNCTFTDNIITGIVNGVTVSKTATFCQFNNNLIDGFTNDGMRGLADSCNFEYNVVKNCYGYDDNHDDGFQSWSTGPTGSVGGGTVKNIVLRGNIFISMTDPNMPLQNPSRGMQGTGNFDGWFENFLIENNVIVSDMYEGIALYGAKNCKIINNTVVKNPYKNVVPVPWIKVAKHKNGSNSTGNIVRNNYTSALSDMNGVTQSNNIVSTSYATHFVDYPNLDLHLKSTSTGINAGTATDAPLIDIEKNTRTGLPDVGAYEYAAGQVDNTAPSVPSNVSVVSTSPNTATIRWSSSTDNLGINSYKVYINGANPVKVTGGDTSLFIRGLTANTSYSVTVSALDANPNESAQSSPVTATTEKGYFPNIANVKASSYETGSTNYAENAIDGSLATRWTSVGSGEWIRFRLDTVYNITAVNAAFFNGHIRSTFFKIEASLDTLNWVTLLDTTMSSGTTTALEQYDVANMPARYIRLTGYGNNGNATTQPYNSLTEFQAISLDTAASATILPVNLLSFNARLSGSQALLDWSTTNEVNHDYFEVQRSDGRTGYTTIATVKKADVTGPVSKYSIIDKALFRGENHYRLAQYDKDGKVAYSAIRNIAFKGSNSIFTVFPNPAKGSLFVASTGQKFEQGAILTLVDMKGAVVQKETFKTAQPVYQVPLNKNIVPGNYVLVVQTAGIRESLGVIVQ